MALPGVMSVALSQVLVVAERLLLPWVRETTSQRWRTGPITVHAAGSTLWRHGHPMILRGVRDL